uniref:Uncharacterized protein n=1 Tax=Poecilia formosa TaxID=48698 RepID=A0A096M8R5_POEFO
HTSLFQDHPKTKANSSKTHLIFSNIHMLPTNPGLFLCEHIWKQADFKEEAAAVCVA